MKNLKIGIRLYIGFGSVLLLMVMMIVTAAMLLRSSNAASDFIVEDVVTKERIAKDWYSYTIANGVRTTSRVMATDPGYEGKLKTEMSDASKQISVIQDKLSKLATEPAAKELLGKVASKRSAYVAIREEIFKSKANGDTAAVQEMLDSKFKPSLLAYENSILDVSEYYRKQIAETSQSMDDEHEKGLYTLIGLGCAAGVIGIGFAFGITKNITRPLQQALSIAEAIASGDLTVTVNATSSDETGQLLEALSKMRNSLESIVEGIRSGTDSIVSESQQIASGNVELSQRTEEQAASLERTASSMEEITSTVRQSADNTTTANQQMGEASQITRKGEESVGKVVVTMQGINESSRKIVDIISVIDSIAFQTNILALNAAVEAARAGEQGRGFAVVASEVRNLAQRSATAAKEIKTLINNSVERVEIGIGQVNEAGQNMNRIMAAIEEVQDMVGSISLATREQSAGIEQVNSAIAQIDQVTQQNTALVEEAAASAESLKERARDLSQLVSVFKTNTEVAPQPRAISRSRTPQLAVVKTARR